MFKSKNIFFNFKKEKEIKERSFLVLPWVYIY